MSEKPKAIRREPKIRGEFAETSWTNLEGPVPAYVKSKTTAERAAGDFLGREGRALELSVINPVGHFPPSMGARSFRVGPDTAALNGWRPA